MDNNRVLDKERLWAMQKHTGLKPKGQSMAENNPMGLKSRTCWLEEQVTMSLLLVLRVQLFFVVLNEDVSTLLTGCAHISTL